MIPSDFQPMSSEDLVLVDADDRAGDDLALVEVGDRRVVVGEDLAVELEQEAVGALDRGRPFGREAGSACCLRPRTWTGHDGKDRQAAVACRS